MEADWKGALRRKFRWSKLRYEWGRWHYETNCCGSTVRSWWVWEGESAE